MLKAFKFSLRSPLFNNVSKSNKMTQIDNISNTYCLIQNITRTVMSQAVEVVAQHQGDGTGFDFHLRKRVIFHFSHSFNLSRIVERRTQCLYTGLRASVWANFAIYYFLFIINSHPSYQSSPLSLWVPCPSPPAADTCPSTDCLCTSQPHCLLLLLHCNTRPHLVMYTDIK